MGRAHAYALCSKLREPAGTMPFNLNYALVRLTA